MTGAARGLACAIAVVLACQSPGPDEAESSDGLMTPQKEREVTADVAAQIRAQAPFVSDPLLLAYINDIGQQIVKQTEPQPFVYRFSIIDDDSLNAFTIGGGYVYMHTGIIEKAGNVTELMGVMAHEVAHVRQRHIARRAEGQGIATLITLATLAAVAFSGGDPSLLALGQGLNVALQLQNTREAEAEADREGVEYMIRAGYDPIGMVRFFERIGRESPGPGADIPAYLYSHPAVEERARTTELMIERIAPPPGLIVADDRLRDMQARLVTIRTKVAGGSGLYARPEPDRAVTDPLLDRARALKLDGNPSEAERVLRDGVVVEKRDPRVWLELAALSEEREDFAQATDDLETAFELDPFVPLVQYRLGVMHKRLGNRTQAVFYLEQAVQNFKPGTSARKRAAFEIDELSVPVFRKSGLSGRADGSGLPDTFVRGRSVHWYGGLNARFLAQNPAVRIDWRGPDGDIAHSETVRMNPLGGLDAELETDGLALGEWSVHAHVGATPIETLTFTLVDEP